MGTLTPVISQIAKTAGAVSTISQTVNTLTGIDDKHLKAQQNLAMQNLQAQQTLEQQQAEAEAKANRQEIALNTEATETARKRALKKALAKQNATFGARGVSSSGSGEAVLLGINNESTEDKGYNTALDQIRYNAIDSNLSNLYQNNLLEKSQLSASQALARELQDY